MNRLSTKIVNFANRTTGIVKALDDPNGPQPLMLGDAPSGSTAPPQGFDQAEWHEFQEFKKYKAAKREQEKAPKREQEDP